MGKMIRSNSENNMKNIKKKILDFLFANKWRKYCTIILFILFCTYIFAPYLLVYFALKVHLSGKHGGGFINVRIEDMYLGRPLMWLGHNISSRGTFYFLKHGNKIEKEIVLNALDRWPHKSDALALISYADAENDSKIRDDIIYAIGRCHNDKTLPFLEKLFERGEAIGLIAMCEVQTVLAENKLLKIYQNTNNLEVKRIILSNGHHSLDFTKTVIIGENNPKIRLNAYWRYLTAGDDKFYEKNKNILWPLYEATESWSYEDNFSPSDLIKTFNEHPELSLDDRKFLLLGHAVLRNPKSIPFLKKISTQNKSEPLRKLAKEILKVIPER